MFHGEKMSIPLKLMHLKLATVTFYALEDIKSRKYPDGINAVHKRKIDELQEEVSYFQEFISKKMARTMFDYLALAALGEARHAQNHSNSETIIDSIPSSRNNAYKSGTKFDPAKFLDDLYDLFADCEWGSGYGGNSWARICKRALEYLKISSICFIDSCINICHNNGIVYNKGILITTPDSEFMGFLDFKAEYSFLDHYFEHSLPVYGECWEFIKKAYNLKLIHSKGNLYIDNDLCFPYINWGDQEIEWIAKPIIQDNEDDDDQETQEKEEEMVRLSRPWR